VEPFRSFLLWQTARNKLAIKLYNQGLCSSYY
jgi:hypothetical protein